LVRGRERREYSSIADEARESVVDVDHDRRGVRERVDGNGDRIPGPPCRATRECECEFNRKNKSEGVKNESEGERYRRSRMAKRWGEMS
jgi:hypothetical protein